MTKTSAISVRVPDLLKAAAEKAALEDSRSLASYVEKLLTEHLKAKGYLGGGPTATMSDETPVAVSRKRSPRMDVAETMKLTLAGSREPTR